MFSSESQTNEKVQDVSHTKYKKLLSRPFGIKTANGLHFYTVFRKIYLNSFEKKAFLWVYLHFLSKICVSASFTVELRTHLICYFVCPPSLSVNINTDFLKCNLFFSKTHNSWKP
jgi:hypothetical protein